MRVCYILIIFLLFTSVFGCLEIKLKSNNGLNKTYNKDLLGCWELYKVNQEGKDILAKAPIIDRIVLVKDNGVDGYAIAYPSENGFIVIRGLTIDTTSGNFLYYRLEEKTDTRYFLNRYEISEDKKNIVMFEQNQQELNRLLKGKKFSGDGGTLQSDDVSGLNLILSKYGKEIFSGKRFYYRKISLGRHE